MVARSPARPRSDAVEAHTARDPIRSARLGRAPHTRRWVPESAAPSYTLHVWRPLIPFAAANLECACAAVAAHPAIFAAAAGGLAASLAYLWLFVLAAIGALDASTPSDCAVAADDASEAAVATDDDACAPNAGVVIWLFLSLVWGLQTVRYVVHVAASGTVGAWWFYPPAHGAWVVGAAVQRACTCSFGTASFAALIVAVLETLKVRTGTGVVLGL